MDKQMKDRYEIASGMISTGIVLAYIGVSLGAILLAAMGIYYCISVSVLSGVLMLIGAVVVCVIGFVIVKCIKYVSEFFCDVAERVLKGNVKIAVDGQAQTSKNAKADVSKKRVLLYNKKDDQYFSGISRQFGTFTILTCDNPNGASVFEDEYSAVSFMKESKLNEKDGWGVKTVIF